jgi:hypothetical protein
MINYGEMRGEPLAADHQPYGFSRSCSRASNLLTGLPVPPSDRQLESSVCSVCENYVGTEC